jgi:predicted nucleic acid-binding protein
MADIGPVFLDANVLIYSLDQTSQPYRETVDVIQQLLKQGAELCTSHHVIEEVLHITQRLKTSTTVSEVANQISTIPGLILVEPAANIEFAKRYAALSERLNMGVNDALLLQLIIDSGIKLLYSYDNKFVNVSRTVGVESIIDRLKSTPQTQML